jgi:sirohydrochlorin cobaltochelatase
MTDQTIVLFAHGARDAQWEEPLRRIAAAIVAQAPAQRVQLAFLGLRSPSLAECVAEIVAAGGTDVLIVPVFIANSGHLMRDLPQIVDVLRAAYPTLAFRLTPAVGEAEPVVQAIATHALALAALNASDEQASAGEGTRCGEP